MEINSITKRAEDLAAKYNPEGYSPFPFGKIEADMKDLRILFSDKLESDVSGTIIYDKDTAAFAILVNRLKPDTRVYFTIAHELGHYFLHQEQIMQTNIIVDGDSYLDGQKALFRSDLIEDRGRLETEANNFAAALLMPERLVRLVWPKLQNIEECAKVFKVSASAMSIRLERLNII